MMCEVKELGKRNPKGWVRMQCIHCLQIYPPTPDHPDRFEAHNCPGRPKEGKEVFAPQSLFSTKELQALFGEDISDRTLIGNRLEALFKELDIPPCASCEGRKTWLNQAHLIVRKKWSWLKEKLLP